MNRLMALKIEAKTQDYKLTKVTHEGLFFETAEEVVVPGFETPQKIAIRCSAKTTSWGKVIYSDENYDYDELESYVEKIMYGEDICINQSDCVLTVEELAAVTQNAITTAVGKMNAEIDEHMGMFNEYRIEHDNFEDGRPKINLYVDGAMYDVMNGTAFTSLYDSIAATLKENGLYFEPETPSIITVCEDVF